MSLGKYKPKIQFLLFYIFISLGFSLQAQTQEVKGNYSYTIGGNAFGGFNIKHSDKMAHLAQTHPTGFEIFINKNTFGPNYWQQRYNFPDIGFSLSYFDHRNEIIGKNIAAITYLDFNLRRRKRSDVLFKIGTGLVFTTNPFDLENNHKNNALSYWLSLVMQGRLGYNIRVSDHWKLNSAITLTHFSNGGFKIPNSGINIITLNLGVSYLLNNDVPSYTLTTIKPTIDTRIKYNVNIASGLKGLHNISGYFPFLNLSAYVDKRIGYKSALNLGIDGFYNLAMKHEVNNSPTDLEKKPDFKRVGLTAGHEMFVGKISLLTQFGVYVYKPFKVDIPVYQRYGLKYYFKEHYFASLLLKTHGGRADVIEWGVGFRI